MQPRAGEWLRRSLLLAGTGAGVGLLIFIAVAPFTGRLGGAAVAGLLFLGCVLGLLVLSARDGCSVLTLVVVLLLLVPQDYVLVGPLRSVGNPALLVSLAALGIWAASRILNLTDVVEMHPVRWVLLVFAITSGIAYAAAMTRGLLEAEAASADRSVFPLLGLVGVALLAVDELGDRDRITTLLQRIVLIGGLAAFFGIMEFVSTFDYAETMRLPGLTANVQMASDTRSGFDRVTAASTHAIEFSVVTAALVPLALHFALHSAARRWLFRLALAVMLVAIPMSVSRSGVLTLCVALPLYAITLAPRARLNVLVLAIIGLGIFRAAVPGLLGTLFSLFRSAGSDPSIAGRTDDYQAIPVLMENHWWFGRGLGTFLPDVYFFLDNQYLGSLLNGGLVGLVAYVALHLVGMGVARGARHRSSDPALRSEAQALVACIAGLGAAAVTYDAFSFRQSSFLLFLVIGCAGAHWSLVRGQPKLGASATSAPDASGARGPGDRVDSSDRLPSRPSHAPVPSSPA